MADGGSAGDVSPRNPNPNQKDDVDDEDSSMAKRFEDLFQAELRTANGTISGISLCAILQELGVAVDEVQLREMVGDAWDEIDYNLARDIFQHLRPTIADIGPAGATGGEKDNVTLVEVVHISPWEWLVRKLTCAATPENTEYRVALPTINILPRHKLIANTGVTMLVTNAVIIVSITVLWLTYADTAAKDNYSRIGETLGNFFEGYNREHMENYGRSLLETTQALATELEIDATKDLEDMRKRMVRFSEAAVSADFYTQDAFSTTAHTAVHALEAFVQLQQALSSRGQTKSSAFWVRSVLAAMTTQSAIGWYTLVIDNTSASVLGESRTLCVGSTSCNLAVECLASRRPRDQVTTWNATTSVLGSSAVAVSADLSSGIRVCSMLPQSSLESIVQRDMIQRSRRSLGALEAILDVEAILAMPSPGSTAAKPAVQWLTPHRYAPASCYTSADEAKCTAQNQLVWTSTVTRQSVSQYLSDKTGVASISVATPNQIFTLMLTAHRSRVVDESMSRIPTLFDWMNNVRINLMGYTIEFSHILMNTTDLTCQQFTNYTKSSGCLGGVCERIPQSFAHLKRVYDTHESGYSIAPDYRPEPVLQALTFSPLSITNIAFIGERDVRILRRTTRTLLVSDIDANNPKFAASFEIQLVHYKGRMQTRSFDPSSPCPARGVTCVTRDGYGVIYRADCNDCSPEFPTNSTLLEYLTKPKLTNCDLAETSPCTQKMAVGGGVGRASMESSVGTVVEMKDSRGVKVIGYHGQITNYSTGYAIKEDYNDVMDPVYKMVYISLGASIGIVALCFVALIALAYQLILGIEQEWLGYKLQIAAEKENFADAVREVMPGAVAEKILTGAGCVMESGMVCIAFVHMSDTSVRAKKWPPMTLCRFLTYTFHLAEVVAISYRVHRLRTIGDTAVFVTSPQDIPMEGGGDEAAENEEWKKHFVLRMLMFCTNIMQLTTIRYAHFPHRNKLTRCVFGGGAFEYPNTSGNAEQLGYLRMPNFQVGINTGVATIVTRQTASAPQHDVHGPTPSLASKLAAASKPQLVLVSEATRDNALKHDKGNGTFQFGESKPIMTRDRGTVKAYFLTVGNVALPTSTFKELGIRFSKLRVAFSSENGGLTRDARDQSIMSVSTASSSDTDTKNSDR